MDIRGSNVAQQLRGFYDRSARHGPIAGHGPSYASAMLKFKRRQAELGKVGIWRSVAARWTTNNGTFIDRDWDIVDY